MNQMTGTLQGTFQNSAHSARYGTLVPALQTLVLLVLFACFPAQSAFAQFSQPANLSGEAEFLPIEEAYQTLPFSNQASLQLEWRISPGYYLYQERFRLLARQQGKTVTLQPTWPKGKHKYDDYFERELEVFYNGVNLDLPNSGLDLSQDFSLHLQSQGCADAGLCYPPRDQQFNYSAETQTFTEQAPTVITETSAPTQATDLPSSDTSWLVAILLAMLGGSVLNLMPCVFPVLSIKALSLASSGEDGAHRKLHGWAYTAGVVLSFVAIASALLIVKAGGEAVGWGFQLQSPLLILALVYLFFVLGMALLGAVEIGTGLANVGGNLANAGGLKGSFFTGTLATLVASPCTAPFMGTALGYAMTQPPAASLSVFAALGFGMALPFLALCYVPHLHKWLPKPGAWMETFKEVLAFPLFLTAIWLLWVLGRQTSTDELVMALCGLLALGFALWLWRFKNWFAKLCLLGAIALAVILPLNSKDTSTDHWDAYDKSQWQQRRQQGQPIFVNVTADWCLTCLANEKLVFSQQSVQIEIADADLMLIKADWTKYNPEITALLAQYQRNGVPLYLMFPADPEAKPEILPQLLTPDLFVEALKRATKGN